MKRKRLIILVIVLVVILITPCPIPIELKDGGTKIYSAILYKVVVWHSLGLGPNGGIKTGTEILFFQYNFLQLD